MGRRKDPSKLPRTAEGVPSSTGEKPTSKNERAGKPGRAFDVWLDRGLHSLFDSVAAEPIPEDLLRLIEEDRKK